MTQSFADAFRLSAVQLFCGVLPLGLIAIVLHWLQSVVHGPLVRRFGWRSVLWTGWIGTPIHELSHAAACLLFGHRIDEIALFRPDPRSGQLGYVKHRYNRNNVLQIVGTFFIGVAPLLGGTLVLYALLWLFYPDAARESLVSDQISGAVASGQLAATLQQLVQLAGAVLLTLVTPENLSTIRFWLFLYVVLCIGSHMSPSAGDYRNALWGGLIIMGLLFVTNSLYLLGGGDPRDLQGLAATILGPVLALFALTVVLCGSAAAVVSSVLSLPAVLFGKRR